MHLMYFTEQPMSTYPEAAGREAGNTALLLSNENFDPVEGSRLYNERIQEYIYAEENGFDGIMLNEHHNAPFCMQAKTNVMGSILAAVTKRVKIVPLGNPLPISDNPVRIAEELAMIDMISKGRLVSGFVRGGGIEQMATNANPAYNRERFNEAHDLILKAWTEPGPWRWEGNHFQLRVVNPWVRPLQQPHPRIWIPGVVSKETVIWAAQHRYPYIGLNTTIEQTKRIQQIYREAAEEVGYTPGPEHSGYLLRVHCQASEEKALDNGRQFMWMQGEFTGLAHPVWANPSGYYSPANRRAFVQIAVGRQQNILASPYEEQLQQLQIIASDPKGVIERLKVILEECRPGILALWANDGKVDHADSMECIRLLGEEVLPALREHAKQHGLTGPFESGTPISLAQTPKDQLRVPASA
jgi:alkanesulfonate monooxygenase SsuD/methylene tetrahydromethanopterin reductase-like flavin-dependent oxidoreductase (luciferase family)